MGRAAVCAGGRRPAREIATREPDGSEWSISRPALALPPPTGTAARPRRPRGGLQSVGVSVYCPARLAVASLISHVIPQRLVQMLNLHRWNCSVFGVSRKMTTINYVRNLAGDDLSADHPHRGQALCFKTCPCPPTSSTPVGRVVLMRIHIIAELPQFRMQFPPSAGNASVALVGVAPTVQTTSAKNADNGLLCAKWSALWAQVCLVGCVVCARTPEHAHEPFDALVNPSTCMWAGSPTLE